MWHTWLHNLMKASYFGFILGRRHHTLTSYFDEDLALFHLFSKKQKLYHWIRNFTKASHLAPYFDEGFLLWLRTLMKVSHLASYIDEGITSGFVLGQGLTILVIFSLKNKDFTFS
jgi:hypothetical protein